MPLAEAFPPSSPPLPSFPLPPPLLCGANGAVEVGFDIGTNPILFLSPQPQVDPAQSPAGSPPRLFRFLLLPFVSFCLRDLPFLGIMPAVSTLEVVILGGTGHWPPVLIDPSVEPTALLGLYRLSQFLVGPLCTVVPIINPCISP